MGVICIMYMYNVRAYVTKIVLFTSRKLGRSPILRSQRPRLLCSIFRINLPGRYECNTKVVAKLLYELVNYRLILSQFHSIILSCCDTPNFLVGVYNTAKHTSANFLRLLRGNFPIFRKSFLARLRGQS